MSIEFKIQSITIQPEDLQEQFPGLITALQSYLPTQKTPKKRRPRKKRLTAGHLIQEIISDIEKE